MLLCLFAAGVLVLSGLAALVTSGKPRLSVVVGSTGAGVGCVLAIIPAVRTLVLGGTETLRGAWNMPWGSFYLELDGLSAFFLVVICLVSGVASVYGAGYLAAWRGRKALGPVCFFYNVLVASMMTVVLARNGLLFLVAWEVMSLSSFFLVTFESERPGVREAGWTYLVATHLGTAFLLTLFALLGQGAGSLDFDNFATFGKSAPHLAGLAFILAVVGFGTKAGFIPLHVWLPEAHPAAPSHVSAVMSGVMIKTGIYGLIRFILFLGPPPMWWGVALVAIGLTSGVLGVLFALAQHDLKRLLAYHSVENIGIITLGLGVGVIGISGGSATIAVLGFAGALLHVLNHALFKGLLFLGTGSVLHATHTGEIDHLGGLLRRMPWTGMTFLVGCVAIVGLPPLNGFVSEFLIYFGAFKGVGTSGPLTVVACLGVIGGLALIGGLAAACFAKAFGIVFLGEPRSVHAQEARESRHLGMLSAMVILAVACVLFGLLGPLTVAGATPAIARAAGLDGATTAAALAPAVTSLSGVILVAGILLIAAGSLLLLRFLLLKGRTVTEAGTWDCGYARPTVRMQYTASSFAQPLTTLFRMFLRTHRTIHMPDELFPKEAAVSTETPDAFRRKVYQPVFRFVLTQLERVRQIQHGHLQLYVLYIAVALLILLLWKMR